MNALKKKIFAIFGTNQVQCRIKRGLPINLFIKIQLSKNLSKQDEVIMERQRFAGVQISNLVSPNYRSEIV